ncbi:MAG: hypothetical protein RL376_617 [Verrucomicrobiota bacterium]
MHTPRFVFSSKLAAALWLSLSGAHAKPVPAPLFTDHAVLQQEKAIPFWGRAEPGEKVTVAFAGAVRSTVADAQGKWRVNLDALPASAEGRDLTFTGADGVPVVAKDVVVGEVWLASGQSNMGFKLSDVDNAAAEKTAADFPAIRQFLVKNIAVLQPAEIVQGSWVVCSPQTMGGFSAVGYFFARDLFQKLGQPVGLINASWGGTPAEAWTRRGALAALPDFKPTMEQEIADMEKAPAEQAAWPAAQAAWEKQNGVADTENAGLAKGWAAPEFNDADWTDAKAMFDLGRVLSIKGGGIFWLRKTVELPPESVGKSFQLKLGYMAEQYDTTYFNGVEIGHTGDKSPLYYTAPRSYTVPAKLLKTGRNVIAVRVVRHDPKGGLYVNSRGLSLPVSLAALPDEQWKVKAEREFPVLTAEVLAARPRLNRSEARTTATTLYNGMIHPLIPYAFRGAIWYQGENNANTAARSKDYARLLPAMIADWRAQWGQGDFPFYMVQLANYQPANRSHADHAWAFMRESQLRIQQTVPNTGMAVIIDIGNADDIHPRNKQDVGKRLALLARAQTYGEKGLVYQSPLYKSSTVEGGKIRVRFDTGGSTLIVGKKTGLDPVVPTPQAKLDWFEVAGADGKYAWADAVIEGDSVVLSSPQVAAPVKARYGWAINPEGCNLYNAAGLPASPFRSQE